MFHFALDKRTIYIIIAILALFAFAQYATNPQALFELLISVPGVLIAITFHEFAHGYAAYKLGDNTAKLEGRLSLNPFHHIDPIGLLMLLVAGFGWGKPVHVNPNNYTRKYSIEKGEAIVSVAGPAMNLLLAIVFSFIFYFIFYLAGASFLQSTIGNVIMLLIQYIIQINVGLGIFNLIPLPPLDGSKIIMPFLPYKAKEWFRNNEQIFYIIFVVIWITGIAGRIISPVINAVTTGILSLGNWIIAWLCSFIVGRN